MLPQADALSKMIDHTLLSPYATEEDLIAHCKSAVEYGFKTVAINNAAISLCRRALEGSDVLCDGAIGFPLGQSTIETKVFETLDAIEKGAQEIDYVINVGALKSRNWHYIETEMKRIVSVCLEHKITSKVIFENCYLTEAEKIQLCKIALDVGPTFIKTSTGFGPEGATLDDVKLMKRCVGSQIQIKAAGGIRTLQQAIAFIEAGATRIGTSAGIAIIQQLQQTHSPSSD